MYIYKRQGCNNSQDQLQYSSDTSSAHNLNQLNLNNSLNRDMRKHSSKEQVLIIGCGIYDKFSGGLSTHGHAQLGEVTMDIAPEVQPDILADITEANIKLNPAYQTVAGDSHFDRISFEMVPCGLFESSRKCKNIAENLKDISSSNAFISIGTGSMVGDNLRNLGHYLRKSGFSDIKIYNPQTEVTILHAQRKTRH